MEKIFKTKFATTKGDTRLSQSAGSQLRDAMTKLIIESLEKSYPNLTIVQGATSVLLLVPNEIEGALPLELKLINKPFDTDETWYSDSLAEKLAKEKEKAKKKELLEQG